MRIVLAQAPRFTIVTPSYAVALLSATLRGRGHTVFPKCFDVSLHRAVTTEEKLLWEDNAARFWDDPAAVAGLIEKYGWLLDEWSREILSHRAQVVGFSVKLWSLEFSLALAARVKRGDPGVFVIFGGPQMNLGSPVGFLEKHRQVDAVCRHEADVSLPRFLEKMVRHGMRPQAEAGFTFRTVGGEIFDCGPIVDLPTAGDVAMADYSDYDFREYAPSQGVPMSLSRGCINRCSFCSEAPAMRRFRAFPARRVFEEIRHHWRTTNCRKPMRVFFCDSLLNGDVQELEKLAELLIAGQPEMTVRYGGPMFIRKELTERYVQKLARSGLKDVLFGLESGSPAVLERMHKPVQLEAAREVFERFHRQGISVVASVIFGHPGESEEEFHKSLTFLRTNAANIDLFLLNYLGVLDGSSLQRQPETYGIDPARTDPLRWVGDEGRNTFDLRIARVSLAAVALGGKVGDIGGLVPDEEPLYDPRQPLAERIGHLERQAEECHRRRLESLAMPEFVDADPAVARGKLVHAVRRDRGWQVVGWARSASGRSDAEILLRNQHGRVVACCVVDCPVGPLEESFPRESLLHTGWDAMLPAEALDGGPNLIRAYFHVPAEGKAYALEGEFTADVCQRRTVPTAEQAVE
jgi:hypothetical protein